MEDLTAAEMEGREQAMHALSALKGVVPGFEGARLRNFGMTIGTRDSRKIVGRSVGMTSKEGCQLKSSVGRESLPVKVVLLPWLSALQ